MKLPQPPGAYDRSYEDQRNRVIEQNQRQSFRRGVDVELSDERLIIRSPDGTRWKITVDNTGSLNTVPL